MRRRAFARDGVLMWTSEALRSPELFISRLALATVVRSPVNHPDSFQF